MALSPGDRLGPYEVVSLLGKGGMGEVYRAHDAKLNRDVAIKVLPAALANDADYLARFQREAQTLAALNHSNIAMIFGIEGNAIVMELVEGETLKGPLPVAEALAIAKQIAEALEAAHEKNIIHRDLKPGNVKVTPEGVVKVLDFGLAKASSERPTQTGPDSPTLTLRATEAGLILGTAGYMSPEQAAGKNVDRRADIWSFGVVFYELLTGKRLFDGETVTHTLADVVRAPIDLSVIEDPQARQLIGRCLDRNIKTRLRDIGEARIAIENAGSAPAAAPVAQVVPAASSRWWPWAAGISTLALLVTGAGWYRSATLPVEPRPMISLNAEIAPGLSLPDGNVNSSQDFFGRSLAISPDGARLVVVLRDAKGNTQLYTRLLHQSQVTPLTGTVNARGPFFSPAGDWIGFIADGKLKKIPVEGGAAVTLCRVSGAYGASWGEDGNIIVAPSWQGGLSRVPDAGGTLATVTKLNAGESTHRWPQVIPGSQAVLFTAATHIGGDFSEANIEVFSPQTGERKTLVRAGFSGRYFADTSGRGGTGHLVFLRQTTLFAVPFDPARLAVTGVPAPVVQDVSSRSGGGDFVLGRNGTFVYHSGRGYEDEWPISWVTRGAVSPKPTVHQQPSERTAQPAQPLHAKVGVYYGPAFSPDGGQLAFAAFKGKDSDIWVKDLARDTVTRLTSLPGWNLHPLWTPDGKYIVFQSQNTAARGLYGIRSDGSSAAERLTEEQPLWTPHSFSPDGKRLLVTNGFNSDIFTLPVETGAGPGGGYRLGKAEPFLSTRFREHSPTFSPDGRWLAYSSDESGETEVYVRPFPGPGGRWQISTGGGGLPKWTRDGRELLFRAGAGNVLAVSYTVKRESFLADKPRVWADIRLRLGGAQGDTWGISPDGKRLAGMLVGDWSEEKPVTHLRFLLNFADELRRKAPAGK